MAAVETLAAATVLILAVVLMVTRSPEASSGVYALASLPQAAVVVALALQAGRGGFLPDAAAILVVKGLWAPRLLRHAVRHGGEIYGQQAAFSPSVLFAGAAGVVLLGLRLGTAVSSEAGVPLGLGLAAMLVGFGTVAVRPELWSQAAGLLMGEAGLATTVLVLAAGLPPLGEALAFGEVLALAAVLRLVARMVTETHGAADARLLRGLRG
jgi:hydrogenase-4 membrane subunit HyfE